MLPDYDTVEQAKSMIQQVLDGEVISQNTEIPDGGGIKLRECW